MNLGMIGVACILAIPAIGSALGAGIAGQAAIGAWKRNYLANKPAPFQLVAFAGAPLTQTIYGFILLLLMKTSTQDPLLLFGVGVAGGVAMALSAVMQGKAGASACDSLGETGKGFGQDMVILGLCETVALFVMVFSMLAIA